MCVCVCVKMVPGSLPARSLSLSHLSLSLLSLSLSLISLSLISLSLSLLSLSLSHLAFSLRLKAISLTLIVVLIFFFFVRIQFSINWMYSNCLINRGWLVGGLGGWLVCECVGGERWKEERERVCVCVSVCEGGDVCSMYM